MPKFTIAIFLIFLSFNLQAQTWEIGGFGGGVGYMGDLNIDNPVKISGIAAGGFVKRNFNGYLSAKINYTFGAISGADSTSANPQFRDRNLSFFTKLNELSLIGEFNFMHYIPEAGQNKYTPFIYLGVGAVGYKPQASYKGQTYDLGPLLTEAESKPYSKYSLAIPYGGGIKYNFAGKWNLIADIGYRMARTDYLDDVSGVYAAPGRLPNDISRALSDRSGEKTNIYIGSTGSQRGDLRAHDTYMFIGLSVSYTFVTQKCYY